MNKLLEEAREGTGKRIWNVHLLLKGGEGERGGRGVRGEGVESAILVKLSRLVQQANKRK